MPSPSTDYPLPAWPPGIFPFEPPHGYFRRLAVHNHQLSARTLAEYVGVNGRNVVPDEMLSFCESFPVRNKHFLADANPQFEGELVVLNGQSFSRAWDYSLAQPRVCLGCLDEEEYYRNWFDLTILRCCPIHRQPLLHSFAGERIQWWHPDLRPFGPDSIDTDAVHEFQSVAWEQYALGRMGVIEPRKIDFLDGQSMRDIVQVAVQLGRAVERGAIASPPKSQSSRAELAAKGYDILADGEDGVVRFFLSLAESNGYSKDSRSLQFGMAKAFGWIAKTVADTDSALGTKMRESLAAAAHELGIYSRKGRNAVAQIPERHLTLNELAPLVRLTPAKTREVATRLGLIEPGLPRSQCHAFSPIAVETLRNALTASVVRAEAAGRLGLPLADFNRFAPEIGLSPLARVGGPGPKDDRFLVSDLDQILVHCHSQAMVPDGEAVPFSGFCQLSGRAGHDVALAIFRGEETPIHWDQNHMGFAGARMARPPVVISTPKKRPYKPRRSIPRAGLSLSDAAGILGTDMGGVHGLIEERHVRTIDDGLGKRTRVNEASLMVFHQKFAPGRLYAEAKGIPHQRIAADFTAANITALRGAGLGPYLWVDRRSVIDAFGEDWDLTKMDPVTEEFWSALRSNLAAEQSPNRLVGAAGNLARLRSGEGNVLADLTIFPRTRIVEFVVSADERKTPRRYTQLLENMATVKTVWPTLSDRSDIQAGVIELVERFRFEDSSSPRWAQVISQIHGLATDLRFLLRPSKSEVQFSVSQLAPSPVF